MSVEVVTPVHTTKTKTKHMESLTLLLLIRKLRPLGKLVVFPFFSFYSS